MEARLLVGRRVGVGWVIPWALGEGNVTRVRSHGESCGGGGWECGMCGGVRVGVAARAVEPRSSMARRGRNRIEGWVRERERGYMGCSRYASGGSWWRPWLLARAECRRAVRATAVTAVSGVVEAA
jgi:hypothetical protein